MNHTNQRLALVLTIALAAVGIALFAANSVGGQSSSEGVPVDFEDSDIDRATLHLWREGPSGCDVWAGGEGDGPQAPDTEGLCQLHIRPPPDASSPSSETRQIQSNVTREESDEDAAMRFALDTRMSEPTNDFPSEVADGAEYPFTIPQSPSAFRTVFHYNSEAVCTNLAPAQPLTFHIRFHKVDEADLDGAPQEGLFDDPFADTTEEVCNTPSPSLGSSGSNRVSVTTGLDEAVRVERNEVLVTEILAVNTDADDENLRWEIYFEDEDFDSRVTVRTDQAIQQAQWATDDTGTVRETFDPDASQSDRFLIPHIALRSPFGPDAVPGSGYELSIQDPNGDYVDLVTDDEGETQTLGLDEKDNLRKRVGSLRVFEIEQPEDRAQPWNYPADLDSGPYEIQTDGIILGDVTGTFEHTVAMGAFAFVLDPVDGESSDHLLQSGSSTTFLLELSNQATSSDVYDIDASFVFSEGGDRWSVDVSGTDANGRVSVEPNETALLRIRVTPPDGVSTGDRARIQVDATSQASGGTQNRTLEAQITDRTLRDVGALVVRHQPLAIGVDRTTEITVQGWNQGTATDGISSTIVANDTNTGNADDFDVEVAQREVTGISPGDVAPIPVDVTTSSNVSEGDEFSFQLEVQSRSDSSVRSTIEIDTVVTAQRDVKIVGLDHQNDEALESLRYSRFNRTDSDGQPSNGVCENGRGNSLSAASECVDYHNWTYHRLEVTNLGDQTETVNLSLLPAGDPAGRTTSQGSGIIGSCTDILPLRMDRMAEQQDVPPVAIVSEIDHADPGSESEISDVELDRQETSVVYLRVGYDGHSPYVDDVDTRNVCDVETHHVTVLASLDDAASKTLDAQTRFIFENTPHMPRDAQARLALDNTYAREDGTLAELPRFTGIELGETTTLNFTLTLQQGHEDQATVRMASDNLIEDLEDEGWQFRLVRLDGPVDREGPLEVIVPSSDEMSPGNHGAIGHTSGVDYNLGLEVTPPTSGFQENERFTFSALAFSQEVRDETDFVDLGVQIGKNFDFGLDPGQQTIKAHPGDEVAFSLAVMNEGATRDGYRISTNASGNVDATARPDEPRISSSSQKVSAIHAEIPEGASGNTEANIEASVMAERGTPDNPADDLGPLTADYRVEVKPPSTLSMETQRPVVSISPGGQNSLNFTITNEKDTPQQLEISQVIGPPGWETSLSDANETRSIAASGTITQTVLIEAPDTIFEGSRFPFVIQAQNTNDTSEFAVAMAEATVQGQTALSLEIEDKKTDVVDRGGTVEFPLLVRNPGTSPVWYQLRTSFESSEWLGTFIDAEQDEELGNETIRVPEGEFRRVLLEVQAPNDVPRGHVESIDVRAFTEGDRSVEERVSLNAEIQDFGVDIEVTGGSAKDAGPGDDVPFEVSITNTGNGPDEISLSFADVEDGAPLYPMTSSLSDDTTPTLEAGETLENVTVEVQVPSPDPEQAPIPSEEGITSIIQAQSGGDVPGADAPTATAEVTTRLVDYVLHDVDDDGAHEVALDLNRDASDGHEVFRDQDVQMIERGELNSSQSVSSEGLYVVDADDDGRAEHIIDTDNDGVGDVYFDPDRARTYAIAFTVDITGDGQAEHPIDAGFDGFIDGVFDPGEEQMRKAAHVDLSGDGRKDLLVDTNGDTFYDRFVNPHTSPPIITDVERDGDLYKVDTQDDGRVDTHYDVQTQSVKDAETANLQGFLGDYWYVLVVFLAVVVAFGVIFYRRL